MGKEERGIEQMQRGLALQESMGSRLRLPLRLLHLFWRLCGDRGEMSADIHRQRRRVATPLTIPFTASPRGQVNEDRFGDMGPVPNFMLRQSKNVTYASPTARLQRAIAHF